MQVDGTRIRRMREERGYGLRRFADHAGLTFGALSRIELGQRNPRPETIKKIADALGVPVAQIAWHADGRVAV